MDKSINRENITLSELYYSFVEEIDKDKSEIQVKKLKLRLVELVNINREMWLFDEMKKTTIEELKQQNSILRENINLWKDKANLYYNKYLLIDGKRNDTG